MKKRITIRLDVEVLDWFRGQKGSYQTLINDALRKHIKADVKPKKVMKMANGSTIEFSESLVSGNWEGIDYDPVEKYKKPRYDQKYKDRNPNERCVECGKALRFCGC